MRPSVLLLLIAAAAAASAHAPDAARLSALLSPENAAAEAEEQNLSDTPLSAPVINTHSDHHHHHRHHPDHQQRQQQEEKERSRPRPQHLAPHPAESQASSSPRSNASTPPPLPYHRQPAATPIPGVHVPLPIDPVVDMPDNAWLLHLYRAVLGREADAAGYAVNYVDLQRGTARDTIYAAFVGSPEFRANPQLADRASFIARGFQTILARSPTPAETAAILPGLANYDGSGGGRQSWLQFLQSLWSAPEYKQTQCAHEYYTLGAQVSMDAPLLADLFAGAARMQLSNESQRVQLSVPSAVRLWDNKLPLLADPRGQGGYLGFTRAFISDNPAVFTIVLLQSADGVSLREVGPIFQPQPGQTFYDAHVAPDYSVCPTRYVMAMECIGHSGAASLCTSQSTTPWLPETWSLPVVVVDGCTGNMQDVCHTRAAESASTGVTLTDGMQRYLAWTQVYDGTGPSDPLVHTYSQSAGPVGSFAAYFGTVMAGHSPIYTMMSSEPQPFCTDAWDCNNRDKQDWKREGSFYYALYNGANYYRCNGRWGISVSRAGRPTAEYTERLPLSRGIPAVRTDTCGISYPMLNVLGGQLYVYYAFVDASGNNYPMRARLVPT